MTGRVRDRYPGVTSSRMDVGGNRAWFGSGRRSGRKDRRSVVVEGPTTEGGSVDRVSDGLRLPEDLHHPSPFHDSDSVVE